MRKLYIIPFRLFTILSLCLLTISCSKPPHEPLHKSRLLVLGTLVDISIWDHDDAISEQAIANIETKLNKIHQTWHAWKTSELTRINKAFKDGQAISVDAATIKLLKNAQELSQNSNYLFNPAIGQLVALWGFHSDERPDSPPPNQADIDALLLQQPSTVALVIQDKTVRSNNPAVQLDFGGFAKGFAVDSAIAELQALDIKDAIVNAGGDLRAIGTHGDRAWRVGVRHPQNPGMIASIETHGDESVFTSGNYERFFDYQGKRYHHIIDPRTGHPANGTLSVTVIHDNATTADAAATALLVAGPERWQDIAQQMGIDQVMLIDDELTVYMTPMMAKRIYFEIDPDPKFILSTTP